MKKSKIGKIYKVTLLRLGKDVLNIITNGSGLRDWDKMRLFLTSKGLYDLIDKAIWENTYNIYPFDGKRGIFENLRYNFFKDPIPERFSSVKHLTLGANFCGDLQIIPQSISRITFEDIFDTPIQGAFPSSVVSLRFGTRFNQTIDGSIPTSLTHLTLGYRFDKDIAGCLPTSILCLKLSRLKVNSVPYSVTDLTYDPIHYRDEYIIGSVPSSVTRLVFGNQFNGSITDNIPVSVKHLTFGYNFNRTIDGQLPDSVTCLTLSSLKKSRVPSSVTDFTYKPFRKEKISIKEKIPPSVTHLTLTGSFNESIIDSIPSSVKHLTFGNIYNKPINGNTPPLLTHLALGDLFNFPLENCVMNSLTHLSLGYSYMGPIATGMFPNLTHLKITVDTFNLINGEIPESVCHLSLVSYLGSRPMYPISTFVTTFQITKHEANPHDN